MSTYPKLCQRIRPAQQLTVKQRRAKSINIVIFTVTVSRLQRLMSQSTWRSPLCETVEDFHSDHAMSLSVCKEGNR